MIIREDRMSPVFRKVHVDGLPFPVTFHEFTAPDGGDPHDHPWPFTSIVRHGGYVERVYRMDGSTEVIHRRVGDVFRIDAGHIHLIVDLPEGECWTEIIPGAHERTSGFYQFRPDGVWHRFWNQPDFTRMEIA